MTVLNFTPASLTLIPWMESAVRSPSSLGFFTLLRAVHAGRIALTAVTGHRTVWTPRSIKSTLPTVVLISNDDDATESYDPDEFRCSMSAIAWARAGLVHAAKAEVEHYEIAGYGCARTYANLLGLHDDEALLAQTLHEESEVNNKFTHVAERINSAAKMPAHAHQPA